MLQEILWLDSGDTIIRGTGTQIQCNYVTRTGYYSWKIFFNYSMHIGRPFASSWRV